MIKPLGAEGKPSTQERALLTEVVTVPPACSPKRMSFAFRSKQWSLNFEKGEKTPKVWWLMHFLWMCDRQAWIPSGQERPLTQVSHFVWELLQSLCRYAKDSHDNLLLQSCFWMKEAPSAELSTVHLLEILRIHLLDRALQDFWVHKQGVLAPKQL